jgi:hypothetical protein
MPLSLGRSLEACGFCNVVLSNHKFFVWAAAPSPYLPGTPGGPPMTPGITSYLPGTPGGQPMTPGTGALDPTSPAIGMGGSLEPESRWGLPDIVVTIRKLGDDAQLGIIKESMPVCTSWSPSSS